MFYTHAIGYLHIQRLIFPNITQPTLHFKESPVICVCHSHHFYSFLCNFWYKYQSYACPPAVLHFSKHVAILHQLVRKKTQFVHTKLLVCVGKETNAAGKMGKKESKLSLVKRLFVCYSTEEKPRNGSYKQRRKGTKKLHRGESKWFVIPALSFREPSSIEQILGDHEAGQMVLRSPFSPKASSPKTDFSAMTSCSRSSSGPKAAQCSRNEDVSATMIQSAFRGYRARRHLRSLRGVGRLHVVMRAENTKLKTTNDVKQMQCFVRVQMQVQSQRLQRLQNQHQTKSIQISEADNNGDWDGSLLSKEELEARRKQKLEAAIKRERAMSYASSHQVRKSPMKSAQDSMEIRSNSHPWWWKWLEEQLPLDSGSQNRADVRKLTLTPPRTVSIQAKSKSRANSNPKERVQGILQGNESQRSSLSPNRYMKQSCMRSMGDNLSQVSTASVPARKPFNRFV